MSVLFLFNGDLDFSRGIRVQLLHVVHFAFIVFAYVCVCVWAYESMRTWMSAPGSLGFTVVAVIFSEAMTSKLPFKKCTQYFYWYKSVLKIQMIVFLWWSHSTLVSFVFWRNDSSGSHRVLVLSWLDDRRVNRVCGSPPEQAAFRWPFFARDTEPDTSFPLL